MTHGLFEWVDVSVPDMERAVAFYSELFGWTTAPPQGGDGSDYLLFRRDGLLAAGVVLSGGHAGWNSYVTVDSADAMATRVAAVGGTVVVPPMEIGQSGRMTWMTDPQGAGLGFWEPRAHRGAESYNRPGFLTWNEVRTRDTAAARDFYEKLMTEWAFETTELDGGLTYTMIKLEGRENAAIAPVGEHFGDSPDHWAVWFTVDDAEADVARIEALGGKAIGPIVETSYGPAARVADPFGSPFLIIGPMVAPD